MTSGTTRLLLLVILIDLESWRTPGILSDLVTYTSSFTIISESLYRFLLYKYRKYNRIEWMDSMILLGSSLIRMNLVGSFDVGLDGAWRLVDLLWTSHVD